MKLEETRSSQEKLEQFYLSFFRKEIGLDFIGMVAALRKFSESKQYCQL